MRIEYIKLKNYRQFKDITIKFRKKTDNDIHICTGVMGTGKTNLLNAINWCLYGEEPYMSKQSQQLPRLNLKTIGEAKRGEDKKITVEIKVSGNSEYLIFNRTEIFRVYGSGTEPAHQNTSVEVAKINKNGNTDILNKEEMYNFLANRFVPKEISKFFFFDGERLDRYFREASSSGIYNAVYNVSQINILDTISKRLKEIRREQNKEAGRANPRIEEVRRKLEENEENFEDNKTKRKKCEKQIIKAKEAIASREEELSNAPNIEVLERNRKILIKEKGEKETFRNDKQKEKQDLLFAYGKIIMLWNSIKYSIKIIEEKIKNKEIPPTIDMSLLEEVLKGDTCSVCGRPLNDSAREKVRGLYKKIIKSSDVANELTSIKEPLKRCSNKIKDFKKKIGKITKELQQYEKDIERAEEEINNIDKKLIGFNAEKITRLHKERRTFEIVLSENQQNLGVLKEQNKNLRNDITALREELNKELDKDKKLKAVKKQIKFSEKALEILDATKEKILSEFRKNIEAETKSFFSNIMWKEHSFEEIMITEDYEISLINPMGFKCLGTISGGEREGLTLAFTMALHKVSGFESPVIVDRPLAMVSGVSRKNIISTLCQISKNKQIILLFTPNDYLSDISEILDEKAANRYKLFLSQDEREIKLEVLQ